MAQDIHPTAVIAPTARLADDVRVGAYCVIGGEVTIGSSTILHSHVVVGGHTTIGSNNEIYPFAALGGTPQHTNYKGGESFLEIGNNNIIREQVTINTGMVEGVMTTQIGNNNHLYIGSHIAHDCVVGDGVIIANAVKLGGHVEIGDSVYLGGGVAVAPFVRIGKHAMIPGLTGVIADIIPFGRMPAMGLRICGINSIGMERRGFSKKQISTVYKAYKMLFMGEGLFKDRLETVRETYGGDDTVGSIIAFIDEGGDRPLCHPEAS